VVPVNKQKVAWETPFLNGVEAEALDPDDLAAGKSPDQAPRRLPREIKEWISAEMKRIDQMQSPIRSHALPQSNRGHSFRHADFNDAGTPGGRFFKRRVFFGRMLCENRSHAQPCVDRMMP
jgi:hypothetical protein